MTRDDVIRKLTELRIIRDAFLDEINHVKDEECPHEWEEIGRSNDHDGWSTHVDIKYYVDYTCLICDKRDSDVTVARER